MHDPSTLAHRIMWPIPHVRKNNHLGGRNKPKFGWQVRIWPFAHHTYISPFVYLFGYELYFDSMVDIWHVDPRGDAGPACHGRKHWKWHIHHMRIQWSFWQSFVQKHITKCAWCGNKSNKEQGRVNHATGHMRCHAKCLSQYIDSMHEHDPATCYNCKQKKLPTIHPAMPADQRELLDSLRVELDLGLVQLAAAIRVYNQRKNSKDGAKWL